MIRRFTIDFKISIEKLSQSSSCPRLKSKILNSKTLPHFHVCILQRERAGQRESVPISFALLF